MPRDDQNDREIFKRLLDERIVFLGGEVDDATANRICAELLLLDALSPTEDISLYINSPGGSVTAGFAIYDAMHAVRADVSTVAIGFAASMGQFLLSSGARGKRFALPNASVVMHQPHGGFGGSAADIQIQAASIGHFKHRMAVITAEQTGRTVEEILTDGDRDRWFTAEQAREYGFVDVVVTGSVEGAALLAR